MATQENIWWVFVPWKFWYEVNEALSIWVLHMVMSNIFHQRLKWEEEVQLLVYNKVQGMWKLFESRDLSVTFLFFLLEAAVD